MSAGPSLARIAAVIGDPARALMLAALMDGRSRTAGELAQAAGITPQTTSAHLAKMADAGLLAIERQGRHRYHRLAGEDVGRALEALMALSPAAPKSTLLGPKDLALRRARTCYDHLAGEIAVALADRWRARGWIGVADDAWILTASGRRGLVALGVPLPDPGHRRPPLKPCLDWSERRPHLGGQLGASLLQSLLARDSLRRRSGTRALSVTDEGARMLGHWCGGR